MTVAHSTVLRFIARLEKEESKPRKIRQRKEKPVQVIQTAPGKPTPGTIKPPSDEIWLRIEAVKQRQAQPEPDAKQFDYDRPTASPCIRAMTLLQTL